MEVVAYEASPEELRYVFPGVVYRRLKTWEQVCGLMEMEADKCSQCPHVIVDGKAVREPGTGKARMIRTPRNIREIQLKEKRGKK